MTNLEKVTADIRQTLPRLMELTDGCEYLEFGRNKLVFQEPHTSISGEDLLYIHDATSLSDITIIGHPPMLNDVLEWLSKLGNHTNTFAVYSSGYFWNADVWADINAPYWDMSKPYLRDQSNELIDYLAGLI